MPIDLNATQWVKDCGLEEGLLSQLQKKGVKEGKSWSFFWLIMYMDFVNPN